MILPWLGLGALAAAAGLEGVSRLAYRKKYLMSYRPKVIGEYPYRSFVVEAKAPLAYEYKKGFRSPMVNINRYGLRGPEPASDGTKKRILVIGESDIFGAKLPRENDLWSVRANRLLEQEGHGGWEALNGGSSIYNTVQHRVFWERELHAASPDILLIRIGGNDISQAWVMGSQWKPGAAWPLSFIHKLERKTKPLRVLGANSWAYHLHKRGAGPQQTGAFQRVDEVFQWDECLETILKSYRNFARDAMRRGTRVAFMGGAPAYEMHMSPEDETRIATLQANWRFFVEGWASYQFLLVDAIKDLAEEMGVPFLNPHQVFLRHPNRFRLYLDLAHLNAQGHEILARFLYESIQTLGWLDG